MISSELRVAASAYIRERLEGEQLLRESPSQNLQIIIVVPIYREPIRRVLELMSSLASLGGDVEVLAVVNNGMEDGTATFHEAINANKLVMDLPLWRNTDGFSSGVTFPEQVLRQAREIRSKLPVYLIDKSSSGHELKTGNVGAARDRGLAEAATRFLQLERNGIVIFLDADVVVEDKDYLKKVTELFKSEPELTMVCGGIDYNPDPDVSQPRERAREIEQLKRFLQKRKSELMQEFLERGKADMAPADACIGLHVLVRAFNAASIGGWPHLDTCEDAVFGKNGACIKRDSIRVCTALRYQHWMGREFDPSVDEVHLPFTEADMLEAQRKISASEQGKAFLIRLEDTPALLYRSISGKVS